MTNEKETKNIGSDEKILLERFNVTEEIGQDRINDICNRFILNAIKEFENGSFDKSTLNELTYSELCIVYDNIGWFAAKAPADIKTAATEYKKMLRRVLVNRISSMTTYVIYTSVTNLPFVSGEGALLLYTSRKIAEAAVKESGFDRLFVREIDSDEFDRYFCEYFCTGYGGVKIDGVAKLELKDLYETEPLKNYGNLCIDACIRMIDYKQTSAALDFKAKKENRSLTIDEVKLISSRSWQASLALLKSNLLVPIQSENGEIKNIPIPVAEFADGKKFILLFTDQNVINSYFQRVVSCAAIPNLIREQYKQIKENDSVSGIIINPGREEYIMTKDMLSHLISSAQ